MKARTNASLSLFLALYLLILAFFILLVSLSTIEEMKARAVMQSLSVTFGNERPADTVIGIDGGDGAWPTIQALMTTLARTVRVAEVQVISPGRLMRLTLPASVVFASDDERPRPALHPLLDRVVATLSSPPPGLELTAEFALATGDDDAARTLAAKRADAFAREMLSRGAPPARLSIALTPVAGDEAWLTFDIDSDGAKSAPASGNAP